MTFKTASIMTEEH